MEIKENLTLRNYNKGNGREIKYIVIHYVGAVSSAKNNADYFKSEYRGASAHYFVDENDIYRVVKDEDIAWHCGTRGTYYSECRNSTSIGIEMCCYNNNGKLDVSENIVNKTIELTKELMRKYNIPVSNVLRHYDVTHKNCPAPFVSDVNRWNDFRLRLNGNISSNTIIHETTQAQENNETQKIQHWLNANYNAGLVEDGLAGKLTKKASTKALQHELNVQFGARLVEDGVFGSKTKQACRNVKKGAKGNITKLIQIMLYFKGYNTNGIDGIFGNGTDGAVKQFQRDNGLAPDGIVGKNTFAKLF